MALKSSGINWSRRDFLGTAIGGSAFVGLGGLRPASLRANAAADPDDAKLAGKILNIVMRYRTDPERIARVLPPGIEPDDEAADVMLDWWVRYPVPGTENIFYPAVYSECGIHVTAKYQGHRGMFQVGMPLDQEWGRTSGRENVGLMKKDGSLSVKRQGKTITGELRRRGKLLYRVTTQMLDEPAHPLFWHRETGFGAFLYRYRLNPNWKEGPLDAADPVELWMRVLGGKTGAYPTEMVAGGPRNCDAARTVFEFVDPSVLDPYSEFPLRKIVGVSYSETGLAPADEAAYRPKAPRTPTRIERLQLIDAKAFEPWVMVNYDRPITKSKPWTPSDWPKKSTAIKLSSDELRQYRERASLNLDLVECADFQLQVAPSLHARTLPPQVQAGSRPIIRILALRVGTSDISSEPFNELWLLARCERNGAEAWYSLSNIVGTGGDVLYGRETFGYPSKTGTVDWQRTGSKSSILGHRMERDFVRLSWEPKAGTSAAPAPARMEVVGLRLTPAYRMMTANGFKEPGPRADMIAQPWSLELTGASPIDSTGYSLEFPAKAGPGKVGTPDPWFEFKEGTVVSAQVGAGMLRRFPAKIIGTVKEYQALYAERYDGATTTELATSGDVKHTFLRP